jgi:hypothetical protein
MNTIVVDLSLSSAVSYVFSGDWALNRSSGIARVDGYRCFSYGLPERDRRWCCCEEVWCDLDGTGLPRGGFTITATANGFSMNETPSSTSISSLKSASGAGRA